MKLFFFLIGFFPFLLTAQCYGSFEVYGAGGVSYIANNFGGLLEERSFSRRPVFAEHFGFGASFVVGQRTLIRTSMQFSRYGDRTVIEAGDLRWGVGHDGNGGFDPSVPSGEPEFGGVNDVYRITYVEAVVALRYQIPSRAAWQPFVEGGVALGGVQLSDSDNLRSFAPIARVGAGFDYAFNDRIGVYGMPVLQYHLRSVSKTEGWRVVPWRAAVEVGLRVFMDPR